jgi:Ca-activated chloride channel family protein
MRLAHPQFLWLLLVVPAAILAYVLAFARRRRALAALGDHPLVARMAESVSPRRKVIRAALFTTALLLVTFTLARPQAGGRARLSRQRGLDLVVALDFSKSMLARDVYPSRLERAKRELENLMDRLAGDRIGLVAFAGEPLTYPPTTDYAALKLFWRDLSPWDMPVGGTAVGRALKSSLDLLVRLRSQEAAVHDGRGQAILLLTDGEDNESEPLEVAEAASKLGIKVFTVGIGSRSGELIPQYDENGNGTITGYLKDDSGKYVTSKLAEDMLLQIASKTGGEYIHADPKLFGVEQITQALTGMKRTENEARLIKEYDEVSDLLLLPAFLLLVGEAVTHERRKRGNAAVATNAKPAGAAS